MKGHRDLWACVGAALVCALGAVLLPVDVVRLGFAAPLVLLLPGYALSAATLARRRIETPMQWILSIGLSLVVLALGSLVLNYLGGLRTAVWALGLFAVVLVACWVAARRRGKATAPWQLKLPWPSLASAALAGVGLAATAAAVVLAFTPVGAKHAIGYSEMWMLPSHQPDAAAVRVGIRNEEHHRTAYGLIAKFGNSPELGVRRFALGPGEKRVFELDAPPLHGSGAVKVGATLYLKARPNVAYRRVSGFVRPNGVAP